LDQVDLQRRIARQIIDGGLSVRVTEQLVQKASAEKPARRSAPRAVDPNIKAVETKLRRAFGTQVKILQAADGRGRVEISFFNTQDLDRIYNILMPQTREV
jgi:ParB family chromosome partitioning protein